MITTTNKQILSVDFVKKWKETPNYDKALLRMSAKKNADFIVAKSPNYALFASAHMGLYFLDMEDATELTTPLSANERKALDRCFLGQPDKREENYCDELKRLRSLPYEEKTIIVNGLDASVEYILSRTCDYFHKVAENTYVIRFNEGFGYVKKALEDFAIGVKEAE